MPTPAEKDDTDDINTDDIKDSNENEEVNPLDLSDEDFDSFLMKDLEDIKDSDDNDNDGDDNSSFVTKDIDDKSEDEVDKPDDNQEDNTDSDTSDDATADSTPDKEDDSKKDTNAKDISTDNKDSKDDSKAESTKKDETSNNINYEAEYKKLLAPFRANNKDMQIDSIEDARTLMQMGANYNKKMAGLKPNLKLIKMLDNHDLLDESKLSFLIDLSKNDPDAIKKLIKDSGVEVAEFDNEEEVKYKSNKTYTVDDREVELDGVLDDIKDTPRFKDTIDIISNKWDEESRSTLIKQPEIIKTINAHVEAGIYDVIQQGIDQQRMLGKLNGISDLAAYKQVGDELNAAGAFNNATPENNSNSNVTAKKTSTKTDSQLKSRKKAASTTKSTTSSKKDLDGFDPLSMSDEDFAKNASSKFF